MKKTQMRCSSCGAVIKLDKNDKSHAVCEYCGSEYYLEWDKLAPKQEKQEKKIDISKKNNDYRLFVMLFFMAIIFIIIACLFSGLEKTKDNNVTASIVSVPVTEKKEIKPEGILKFLVESAYNKSLDEISREEIDAIRWISIHSNLDETRIAYSLDDPYEKEDATLIWFVAPKDVSYHYMSSLRAFKGITVVDGYCLSKEDYEGLVLKRFEGSCSSFNELADSLSNPEALLAYKNYEDELTIEGIERLTSLESLYIKSKNIADIKNLSKASNLKELCFDIYKEKYSYSFLAEMANLQKLTFKAEEVRNIDFISEMKGLKYLEFIDCNITDFSPLSCLDNLEVLKWSGCGELTNISAAEELVSLKELSLALNSECDSFDFSKLVNLEELSINQITNAKYSGFENLSKLKKLKIRSSKYNTDTMDFSFASDLSSLEEVDMEGFETFGNITPIFNASNLKKINLSNFKGEIDFNKLNDNENLEELRIDKIKLFENVYIESDGFITNIYYDDVNLTDNLDFLSHFKNLKVLSIENNKLTDVEFIAFLDNLEYLSVAGNDIISIAPLNGHNNLKIVDCTDNPSDDYEILDSQIQIIE